LAKPSCCDKHLPGGMYRFSVFVAYGRSIFIIVFLVFMLGLCSGLVLFSPTMQIKELKKVVSIVSYKVKSCYAFLGYIFRIFDFLMFLHQIFCYFT
jgi:hypothetical protein